MKTTCNGNMTKEKTAAIAIAWYAIARTVQAQRNGAQSRNVDKTLRRFITKGRKVSKARTVLRLKIKGWDACEWSHNVLRVCFPSPCMYALHAICCCFRVVALK